MTLSSNLSDKEEVVRSPGAAADAPPSFNKTRVTELRKLGQKRALWSEVMAKWKASHVLRTWGSEYDMETLPIGKW